VSDRRRNDRRDRLVDVAIGLFRRHGPNGTAVGAVCAAGGATKGVFTHHFPGGKDELIAAAVERNAGQVDELVERALAAAPTTGAAVEQMFGFYADLLDRDPDFGCPIAASVVDTHAGSDRVRAAAGAAFTRWEARMASAIASQGTPYPAAEHLAVTVVAALEGAILLALARRQPRLLRVVVTGLAAAVDQAAPG
jgi:AcrR family transcriptional regulator